SIHRYAIACDLTNNSAIERLRRIKNIDSSKPLSILCHSFRDIDKYTAGFPSGDGQGHANLFKAVKHCLPGPSAELFLIQTMNFQLPSRLLNCDFCKV
ncbi:yrdC domain-containing protein mitochondrial-like, partial [Trifolium pratense]